MLLLFHIPTLSYWTNSGYAYVYVPSLGRPIKRSKFVLDCVGISVPRGYIIHHKDEDRLNDDPSNLEVMTGTEHVQLHHTGRISSEENRKNIRTASVSRWTNEAKEEHSKVMSVYHTTHKVSDAACNAISEGLRKAWERKRVHNTQKI